MDRRKLMVMVGALIFAGLCATMARGLFGGGAANAAVGAPAPIGQEVLVATRTLAVGTIVTPDAFRYQPWPGELVDKAYFVRGQGEEPAKLAGTVVRFPITAGQPLTQGALVKPGDRGFLAAALAPGMRAITVPTSIQNGVAGFVFPGDRVDLLLTQTGADPSGQAVKASETIVRNLRVLATDQRTERSSDADGKAVASGFSTVTLETTPKIAERIAVAQTIGTLSLALRPIAEDRLELEQQVADGTIDLPAAAQGSRAEKQMLLQLAARPVESDSATTGAEVSRFQRPLRPAAASAPAPVRFVAAPASPRPRGSLVTIARGQAVSQVVAGGL